jgi:hypothetical protein
MPLPHKHRGWPATWPRKEPCALLNTANRGKPFRCLPRDGWPAANFKSSRDFAGHVARALVDRELAALVL